MLTVVVVTQRLVLVASGDAQVGMATLDEPTLAAALRKTVEDGSRLENVWITQMAAEISAKPELATMPGMRKIARYGGPEARMWRS